MAEKNDFDWWKLFEMPEDTKPKPRQKRDFGKFSREGVPKKGWTRVGSEDLGSLDAECEMCEKQRIRYVHYMEHPGYPGVLGVGKVCASHMEEDYKSAH